MQIWLPLTMTFVAGLATVLGGLFGLAVKKLKMEQKHILALGLGASAGAMIYIALVELVPLAGEHFSSDYGEKASNWLLILGFFGGIALIGTIDRFVPKPLNPHEPGELTDPERGHALLNAGKLTAVALALHNFPEGFATFWVAYDDLALGIGLMTAIIIHNIPEGLAVALPIYYATGNGRKALGWATVSGMAEPAGALIGYLLLAPIMSELVLGMSFAAVAGIMFFVCIDELLPAAREFGEHHWSMYGVLFGAGLMAVSLALI